LLSGTGDVIEPDDGVIAIGSGGMYALSAGRALLRNTELSAAEIAKRAIQIAGEICVYTNSEIVLEEVSS
jgi:ATP-dependent HslUV protease subunit HslV